MVCGSVHGAATHHIFPSLCPTLVGIVGACTLQSLQSVGTCELISEHRAPGSVTSLPVGFEVVPES